MDKLALLKTVPVFGGLDENLLAKLSGLLKEARFAAGSEIFAQGRPADSFYIIAAGEVIISKKLGPGQEKTLAVLGAGNVFGEMAFFSDSPRTADVISRTDTALWKIERADFIRFISDEPKAGLRITSGLLQVAMDRLDQTSRELATVYHTGNMISSGRKLSDILRDIVDEALLAIPEADNGAAYLYNEYNEEYDPAAAPPGAGEIPALHPLIEYLKKKGEGEITSSSGNIKPPIPEICKNAGSILLSPMIKNSSLLGFILLWNLEKHNVFKKGHLLLVTTISNQLAEAIENIRHQQEERDRQRLSDAKQSY